MAYLRWVLRPYLYLTYAFEKCLQRGAFGKNRAVFDDPCQEQQSTPLKTSLFAHHVKQFHESSCSVASVVSVINALLERNGRLTFPPITQHQLLDTVTAAHWKERMSPEGYNGRRGLPLHVLERVVRASLTTYQIPHRFVEAVQASKHPRQSRQMKNQLRKRLQEFEKHGDSLIIAHFDQGHFLPELHIPHISPVGGFDRATDRVMILDVDPFVPHFYHVPFEQFYAGLSHDYNVIFQRYGYGSGGYIHIQL